MIRAYVPDELRPGDQVRYLRQVRPSGRIDFAHGFGTVERTDIEVGSTPCVEVRTDDGPIITVPISAAKPLTQLTFGVN